MAKSEGPVLVIGATGQQGGATARALLRRGRAAHALVRDPNAAAAAALSRAGAYLVTGDLDDPDSLRTALGAVEAVFLGAVSFSTQSVNCCMNWTLVAGSPSAGCPHGQS